MKNWRKKMIRHARMFLPKGNQIFRRFSSIDDKKALLESLKNRRDTLKQENSCFVSKEAQSTSSPLEDKKVLLQSLQNFRSKLHQENDSTLEYKKILKESLAKKLETLKSDNATAAAEKNFSVSKKVDDLSDDSIKTIFIKQGKRQETHLPRTTKIVVEQAPPQPIYYSQPVAPPSPQPVYYSQPIAPPSPQPSIVVQQTQTPIPPQYVVQQSSQQNQQSSQQSPPPPLPPPPFSSTPEINIDENEPSPWGAVIVGGAIVLVAAGALYFAWKWRKNRKAVEKDQKKLKEERDNRKKETQKESDRFEMTKEEEELDKEIARLQREIENEERLQKAMKRIK